MFQESNLHMLFVTLWMTTIKVKIISAKQKPLIISSSVFPIYLAGIHSYTFLKAID